MLYKILGEIGMLKASKINKLENFVSGWYIDKKVCDDLIAYYERTPYLPEDESERDENNTPYKRPGKLGLDFGLPGVQKEWKHSTDICVSTNWNHQELRSYYEQLGLVCAEYKKQYEYCSIQHDEWGLVENWNIQKYEPKEGYFKDHFERTGLRSSLRHLTFMTYLNDVNDGGETEFIYQKLKVKPEKGLTLIWPAEWTFPHKGITSKTEVKYIATGWYSYMQRDGWPPFEELDKVLDDPEAILHWPDKGITKRGDTQWEKLTTKGHRTKLSGKF